MVNTALAFMMGRTDRQAELVAGLAPGRRIGSWHAAMVDMHRPSPASRHTAWQRRHVAEMVGIGHPALAALAGAAACFGEHHSVGLHGAFPHRIIGSTVTIIAVSKS